MRCALIGVTGQLGFDLARTFDLPGELIKLLSLVAEERGNVIAVEHHREGVDISVSETEIGLTLVTRDEAHCQQILAAVKQRGYTVERLS